MIYILSGIAKSGKTYLSKEILKRHNISVFSTDYIMMMLYHAKKETKLDINASDSSVSRIIEPYIYGIIKSMIDYKSDYLIEGVHFTTDFSKKLIDEFGDKVKVLYIGYKDVSLNDKVKELYKFKDVMNNPWLFDFQNQKLEDIVKYMIAESDRIYKECLIHNLEYVEVKNIANQKEEIMKKLIG